MIKNRRLPGSIIILEAFILLFAAGCQLLNPASPPAVVGTVTTVSSGLGQTPQLTDTPQPPQAETVQPINPEETSDSPLATPEPILVDTIAPPADTPTNASTATKSLVPTATRWAYPTWTRAPTRTPSISPTPTPPFAYLRIVRPGPFSKINSPLKVEAGVSPGDDGLVLVDLIGEDGRTITRQRLNFSEFIGRSIGIAPELEFEIAGVAETARLVLSVEDHFGRKIAISSIEVVLISIGDNQIYPSGYQNAPYLVKEPVADQVITGGVLKISGSARPVNLTPLIFELINEQGQVIAADTRQIDLPGGDLSHTPFSLELPYQVTAATRVRLSIRQVSDDRIPGTVALWSLPLLLQP